MFTKWLEAQGLARLTLAILFTTSVVCLSYTWGYYEVILNRLKRWKHRVHGQGRCALPVGWAAACRRWRNGLLHALQVAASLTTKTYCMLRATLPELKPMLAAQSATVADAAADGPLARVAGHQQ
jgi:hypothetical protein